MSTGERRKVLAIGLDAASEPLIDAMVGKGRLPNLERARRRSARWEIDGGAACLRNQMWQQFNFGREVDGDRSRMFVFDPDTYRCNIRDARRVDAGGPQFWDRPDIQTLVFDVPHSALTDTGTALTAWGGHAPFFPRTSHPAGLIDELDRRVGIHPGFVNDYDSAWHDRRAIKRLADGLVAGARRRGEAFDVLNGRFPSWELAIVVMSEMHAAGHFWWHGTDAGHPLHGSPTAELARAELERVYDAVDAAVGDLAAAAPPDTTIVLFSIDDMRSGHGDAPSIVLLPELLHRLHFGKGLLRSADTDAWKAAGCPPVVPRDGWVWRRHLDSQLVEPPPPVHWLKRLPGYDWVKQTPVGERFIGWVKGRPIGAQGIPIPPESRRDDRDDVDSNDLLFTAHYQPYWSQMPAFAVPSFNPGAVRLNLAGRERSGMVAPEDYERVCDEIEAAVRACTNPRTGRPIVDDVQRPRRADPMAPDGDFADMVFLWQPELIDAFEHPTLGVIGPVPMHRAGNHTSAGFLYVDAAGVDSGERGLRHALDIPPTLIDLIGAAPGEHLDGVSVLGRHAPAVPG